MFDVAVELQRFRISARDEEIERIAKSVALLATLFKDVANLVIDHGTLVDRIDYNMEQVGDCLCLGSDWCGGFADCGSCCAR